MSHSGHAKPAADGAAIGLATPPIAIEVAYALPDRQAILRITVPPGTTALQAIEMSGIRQRFAGIEAQPTVGIFSHKVGLDYIMQEGDRLEIYRPLLADPKEVRRRKAEEQKSKNRNLAGSEAGKPRRH
jgi:putative ubiquitin-RnfH superfamily antitoxin RatB of RatAB toxin-antitoxin module